MKVTTFTRQALAVRREHRRMRKAGWELCAEPCWELVRGHRMTERIVAAQPARNGKSIWFKTEKA